VPDAWIRTGKGGVVRSLRSRTFNELTIHAEPGKSNTATIAERRSPERHATTAQGRDPLRFG
jgi:hypothetical protein